MKLSGLSKPQKSQVLASCGNVCEPEKIGDAMRVQFSGLHKSESRYNKDGNLGKGRPDRRHAYQAEVDYEDLEWEVADDEEYWDDGYQTELEDELNALRDDVEDGDEQAAEQLALLSECLATEQAAYIARKDLRDIKSQYRRSDRTQAMSGRGERSGGEMSEDRKKRIEESEKKTRCRVCGETGHWAGDSECNEKD